MMQQPSNEAGSDHRSIDEEETQMAAKKTTRSKARKTVSRAKATKKTSARSARKAPRGGTFPPQAIEIF
ncbi:MAG: hypothetical protein HYR74_03160 [Candidatus Eisenbacteria bacterium]|nr:hypothetical protein [Candidatus Eisenbacteria bacterium]